MKICFDHQVFALQRYGGVTRYFVELLCELRHLGEDALAIAPAHFNAYLARIDARHPLTFHLPWPRSGLKYRTDLTRPLFELGLAVARPDVVHETHYLLGSRHLRRARAVVTTCHDMIMEKFPSSIAGAEARKQLRRRSFDRADAIVCISHNTREDLLGFYPQYETKARVVHHGVSAPAVCVSSQLPPPISGPYLLYVGIRDSYKNFSGLIHALGRSRTLTADFTLVCFGGGAFSARERALIAENGLSAERVVQLGGDDTLLSTLYHHAAAFVFPSRYEGFGMPLTEALIHGCPIACSDASCFPEIGGEAVDYFDPDDAESMACAIERAVARNTEADRALRIARGQHFSWNACARATREVYRSVV